MHALVINILGACIFVLSVVAPRGIPCNNWASNRHLVQVMGFFRSSLIGHASYNCPIVKIDPKCRSDPSNLTTGCDLADWLVVTS